LCGLALFAALLSHVAASSNGNLTPAEEGGVGLNSSHAGSNASDSGSQGHKRVHGIHVISVEFAAVKEPLIFTVVVLLAGLSKIGTFSSLSFLCHIVEYFVYCWH
jgi:hypothetical protein